MNKVDASLVVRVMKNLNKTLAESNNVMPSHLNIFITNYLHTLEEKNLWGVLTSFNILQKYIVEQSNQETLNVIMNRLEESGKIPKTMKKYDLSTIEGFMEAFNDEFVREMVSGASIGGRMSGLGSNAQVNATGMAGTDPLLGKKKKNKIVNVLNRRL